MCWALGVALLGESFVKGWQHAMWIGVAVMGLLLLVFVIARALKGGAGM